MYIKTNLKSKASNF